MHISPHNFVKLLCSPHKKRLTKNFDKYCYLYIIVYSPLLGGESIVNKIFVRPSRGGCAPRNNFQFWQSLLWRQVNGYSNNSLGTQIEIFKITNHYTNHATKHKSNSYVSQFLSYTWHEGPTIFPKRAPLLPTPAEYSLFVSTLCYLFPLFPFQNTHTRTHSVLINVRLYFISLKQHEYVQYIHTYTVVSLYVAVLFACVVLLLLCFSVSRMCM